MKLKPYYSLSDFPDRKGLGKNWMATCPLCDKKHLSISKENGLFHCFSPDCDFNGQLDDFKPYAYQHNALGVRNCDTDVNLGVLKKRKKVDGLGFMVNGNSSDQESINHQPSTINSQSLEEGFLPEDYVSLESSVIKALKPLDSDPAVVKYLEQIHIPMSVAQQAGCMATTRTFNNIKRPCLCYVNRLYGNIINVKYRAVDAKLFTQDAQKAKDAPSAPYNIECLNPLKVYGSEFMVNGDHPDEELSTNHQPSTINPLIITEGEKDCLTVLAAGYEQVISIPNGAGNKPETCFAPFMSWLKQVRSVIICGDMDKAGRVMKRNLKAFFSELRIPVAIATMSSGCKDISEVNQNFGLEEVRRVLSSAEFPQNPDIIRISNIRNATKDFMNNIYDHGFSIGYGKLTDKHLLLTDEGGLIIITGRPNSGKTDWLRCTLTRLLVTGRGCCFLTFEEPKKEKHIGHIIEVLMGTRQLKCYTDQQQERILDYLEPILCDLDMRQSPPTTKNIISHADELLRDGFPMKFLIIDPYLFVDMGSSKENETKLIKDMLTKLQTWGRNKNVWVCMVAHPRMLNSTAEGEFEEIDPYKVSGSAHWANLADFLISVKRIFPAGENNDEGSANPSFTKVSVLKVRDQDLCHTGNIYYMRHPSGRYCERDSDTVCKQEIAQYDGIRCEQQRPWIDV